MTPTDTCSADTCSCNDLPILECVECGERPMISPHDGLCAECKVYLGAPA